MADICWRYGEVQLDWFRSLRTEVGKDSVLLKWHRLFINYMNVPVYSVRVVWTTVMTLSWCYFFPFESINHQTLFFSNIDKTPLLSLSQNQLPAKHIFTRHTPAHCFNAICVLLVIHKVLLNLLFWFWKQSSITTTRLSWRCSSSAEENMIKNGWNVVRDHSIRGTSISCLSHYDDRWPSQ